jgi:hypothetical protein
MSNSSDPDENTYRSHLEDIEDGCGCVEVWEATSADRKNDDNTRPNEE